MTLPPFEYVAPLELREALEILSRENARVLAGGTDLLINLRKEKIRNLLLVDLKKIDELYFLEEKKDSIEIGPLMLLESLKFENSIIKSAPSLIGAIRSMGSVQIRNRGTIGGNICNASPCADTIPPLLIHNAILTLRNSSGERKIKLADFIKGPYKTDLKGGEILTVIEIEKLNKGGEFFFKLGRRGAMNKARMNFAVYISLDSKGKIGDARIAGGALTPYPKRFNRAEEILKGETPGEVIFGDAAKKVKEEVMEITGIRWSTPYKSVVIENLLKWVLFESLKKAYEKNKN